MSQIATRIRFINAIIASDRAWSSFPEEFVNNIVTPFPKTDDVGIL
ncbi:hypothetical protein [Nostoc commune]|nr:hypothetical protein [Nostoc commune]